MTLALCACAQVDPYRVSKDGYTKPANIQSPGDCPAASLLGGTGPDSYDSPSSRSTSRVYFADRAQAEAAIAMASGKPAQGRAYVVGVHTRMASQRRPRRRERAQVPRNAAG